MRHAGPGNRRVSSLLVLFAFCMSLLPQATFAQDDDPSPVFGSLAIYVTGTDGASLGGATFTVTDASGAAQSVTSSDGLAMATNLPVGWASVVQTGAPDGYTFSGAVEGATVEAGGTAEIWITNTAPPPDSDGDGNPDDTDSTPYGELDSDDVPDDIDNCAAVNNPDQSDSDGDGIGDACDETPLPPAPDADGDGTPDDQDPTPNGEQDADNIPDDIDNCPTVSNSDQADADGDGVGDACSTEDPEVSAAAVEDISVLAGVRNNTVNGDLNGPFLSTASALPGQSVSFAMLITNSGSEPIPNISAISTIPGEIIRDGGGYNIGMGCAYPTTYPATFTCNVTAIPYEGLSTLGVYFNVDVVDFPSAEACENGLEMTAAITSIYGEPVNLTSTARIDLVCPEPVVPALPTVTDASCVNGVYQAPVITEAETPGITYNYNPSLTEIAATGGILTITATKTQSVAWDADTAVWSMEGDTATATVEVETPACLAVTKTQQVNEFPGGPILDTTAVEAGNQVIYRVNITNTGASSGSYQISDWLTSALEVQIVSPAAGSSCTSGTGVGGGFSCAGSVPATSTRTFTISAVVPTLSLNDCLNGFDNIATGRDATTLADFASNTVHLDADCTLVTPQLPSTTAGSCVDGVSTAPTVTGAETEGITYDYTPTLEEIVVSGGPLTITATKAEDADWDADTAVWSIDGNTATAEIEVIAPPCFSIAKTVSIDGGPESSSGVAEPGSTIEFILRISNTGGGSAPTFTIQDSFTNFLIATSATGQIYGGPELTADCSIVFPPGSPNFECSGIIGPGGLLEPDVTLRVPENLTADQCAAGIDNTAYVTSVAGESVSIPSNTVQVDLVCPVAPELPTVSPGTCLDGTYTAPVVTLPETSGVTYDTEWGPANRSDGKRTLTVTATKDPAFVWDLDPAVWEVDGNVATTTIDVDAPPCLSIVKSVSINGGAAGPSGTARSGDDITYYITLTNTGGSVGTYALQDSFPPMLTWRNYTQVTYAGNQSFVYCSGTSTPEFNRLTIDCYGVLEPDISIAADATLTNTNITPEDCGTGIDNNATLSSGSGVRYSNTVRVEFVCAEVAPVLPETSNGSCLNGTFNPPTFTPATTTGVAYSYDPSVADVLATGGDLVITATLGGGFLWGEVDLEIWDVEGSLATATISVEVPPCFTFTKDIVSGEGPYAADAVIAYDLTVTNTGTVDLTGVSVSDSLVDDLACAIDGTPVSLTAVLGGAEALDCTGSHTVTQAEIDLGEPLVNTATATTGNAGSLTASATALLAGQEPGISLTKSVDPPVISEPGTVTYTFVLQNTGNVTLTDVALVDDLIDLATVDCDPAGGLQGVPTSLAVGAEPTTCTISVEIDQPQIDARQPIVNTAHVTSAETTSPDATATLTVIPVDSLSLVKSVDPLLVDAPTTVTFTFVIQNRGSASLSGVALVDDLIDPALLDCDVAEGIQGVPTTIAANSEPITCTAPYAIDQTAIDAGEPIVNTAQVTSDQVDSNEASATVSIDQRPDLAVTKVVTSASTDLDQGDVVTYEIEVINTGNVTITDIAVTDPGADTLTCDSLPDSLAPDESATCAASTELTEADLLAGFYTNTVTATALVPQERGEMQGFLQAEPILLEATASATVTMVAVDPALTIEKTVSPTGPVSAGETLTYTFTVTNTGNVTVEQVVIDDPLPGLVWDASDGVVGDLARGAFVTVTATYVVTEDDARAGELTNVAVAAGERIDCGPETDDQIRRFQAGDDCAVVSNEATVTVQVKALPVEPTPTATSVPTTPAVPSNPTPGSVTTLPTTGQTPPDGSGGLILGLLAAAFGLSALAAFVWQGSGQRLARRSGTNGRHQGE